MHSLIPDKTDPTPQNIKTKYANVAETENQDAKTIMDHFSLTEDGNKILDVAKSSLIECSEEEFGEILLECMVFRSAKSLEHLSKIITHYKDVLTQINVKLDQSMLTVANMYSEFPDKLTQIMIRLLTIDFIKPIHLILLFKGQIKDFVELKGKSEDLSVWDFHDQLRLQRGVIEWVRA